MRKVTFVLPHGGSAGGVRVTVEMVTRLIGRGYGGRIAYRLQPFFSKEQLLDLAKLGLRRIQGAENFDWLRQFKGPKQSFTSLKDVRFSKGEIVIAVAQDTVKDVDELNAPVVKLRYCHCLFDHLPERKEVAWGGPMSTISVSPGMVPELEKYAGNSVIGVVPNGINTSEYFVEPATRDGIGLIFRDTPHKGPEVAKNIVKDARSRFPDLAWHMFGTSRRPRDFTPAEYRQFPSIIKAREIYNSCKIWLVTSRDEGFCLPILEAMACGCVVITSDHLVAADLIEDGVNGFIVPYGDTKAYFQKIGFLLGNEARRQEMVRRGLETAQKFTWERAVTKMEEVLELLEQREAVKPLLASC